MNVLNIILLTLGLVLSLFFIKPYIKTKESRKLALKIFAALFVCSFAAYFFVKKSMQGPDFFQCGIEQLRTNKYINSKVGDFQSYSYNPALFKNINNRATFDIDLNGSDDTLLLKCIMIKHNNAWILAYFNRRASK